MIHVLFLALATLPTSPKVALLPCDPHVEATDDEAEWLDKKLQRELGSIVDLVPRQDVIDAMTAQGADGSLNCDDECLTKIGKALKADRVVSQTLSLQKKVQSVGTVWVWAVHQVDVNSGKPFGHFEIRGPPGSGKMTTIRLADHILATQNKQLSIQDQS